MTSPTLFDRETVAVEPVRFTVHGLAQTAGSKRSFPYFKDVPEVAAKIFGRLRTIRGSSPPEYIAAIIAELKEASIGVRVTDDNPDAKAWKALVAKHARRAMAGRQPLTGALVCEMTFYRTRPRNHYGTGRNESVLRRAAPRHPIVRPDVLKLARAAEDAMTGIVYVDDAQIVTERIRKRYGEPARVEIVVMEETEE